MTEENCDSETIPGITVPLDKIVATTINTDNHGFPVKRCSSRKRSLPDFFVPTHSRPSKRLHDGPGRPRKKSLCESPASQPSQRVPSRLRKQRSDETDVEVPTTETTQIPSSQHLRHGPGRPRKQRLDVREMKGETVLSPEVTEAPVVSPPPAAPLGSTGDCLLQVSAPTSSPEAVAPTLLWSTSDVEVSPMAATQSPASQPLRRGPGPPGKQQSDGESPASQPFRHVSSRPRKRRSDEIDVEVPTTETTQIPSSQHLRRGRGRPRKQRLDVHEMKGETVVSPEVTEAPAVSPPPAAPLGSTRDCLLQVSAPKSSPEAVAPTLLWSTSDVEVLPMAATQSPASQPLRHGPDPAGKQQSDGDETLKVHGIIPGTMLLPEVLGSIGESPLQVSVTRSSPKAVATTPLGPPSNMPLELPSNEKDTKLNLKPSRLLMHPSETNYTPQILDEELKKVTVQVKSLLVKKLLFNSGNDVDYMVNQAKTTFRYLNGIGVDYGSFYRNIIEHIKHFSDLRDAEKEETMSSLSALQKNYENAILSLNDVEEDLGRTPGELEKAKEKKETLKRQIEDLKQEVAGIEHEEEHLKHEEIKYKEARDVAKAKMQELGTKLEAAQAKLREIEQRKKAALRGIESTTRYLQSTFLDNLD